MNGNVAQFSSVIEIDNKNKIIIETLSFINNFENRTKIYLMLLVETRFLFVEATEILAIPVMKTITNVTHFYKIKFQIELETNKKNLIGVATIMDRNYFYLKTPELLTYQKPTIFEKNNPKESIVNCVHRFKNINADLFNKLENWLIIMKNIGYSKIIFYSYYAPEQFTQFLKEKFSDFVEIVNYNLHKEDICHISLKKLNSDPKNSFFKNEIIFCFNNYKRFFENYNKTLGFIDQAVNRLGSNDCLLHSKFNFKYLTNFDFDEFIFPRKFNTHFYKEFKLIKIDLCKTLEMYSLENKNNYSILSFIKKLKNKFSSDIAYFEFENFQLLTEFKSIENQIYNNTNGNIYYNSSFAKIKFEFANNQDIDKMKQLMSIKSCMNKTFSNIHPNMRNVIGSIIDNRKGKSIFLTDKTFSINPHSAFSISKNTNSVKISSKIANVIHFRNADTGIIKIVPGDYLNFDVEYLIFLKTIFNY